MFVSRMTRLWSAGYGCLVRSVYYLVVNICRRYCEQPIAEVADAPIWIDAGLI